jgi:hypothetical protein
VRQESYFDERFELVLRVLQQVFVEQNGARSEQHQHSGAAKRKIAVLCKLRDRRTGAARAVHCLALHRMQHKNQSISDQRRSRW